MDITFPGLPLQTGTFTLVTAPSAARQQMLLLAARLAVLTPLVVLDAGNSFNALQIARLLRRWKSSAEVHIILNQILISRAFTCYQVVQLLAQKHAAETPILLLDMLSTFHDENISLAERQLLLKKCLAKLGELRITNPLIVSIRPPDPEMPGSLTMSRRVQAYATFNINPYQAYSPTQLKMF